MLTGLWYNKMRNDGIDPYFSKYNKKVFHIGKEALL